MEGKYRVIKPIYYDAFSCLAGDCKFTCCMQWDITVDPLTLKKWQNFGIKTKNYVVAKEGCHVMKLNEKGNCPFLQENLLCKMVAEHGEESISVTCHTFPREKHVFDDRIEYTLTMGCPEALHLLWTEDRFEIKEECLVEKSEDNAEIKQENARGCSPENLNNIPNLEIDDKLAADEALLQFRQSCIELVQYQNVTIEEALRIAFYLALDMDAKEEIEIEYVRSLFDEKNIKEMQKLMGQIPRDPLEHVVEQNELFLDLAENYRKKGLYRDILEPLASLAEEYENPAMGQKFLEKRNLFEKEWKKWEGKIRLLFAEEFYSTLYLPEGDNYSILLKLEWMAILYAALKQCFFLQSQLEEGLTEETMKDIVIMLVRMTGYSEADIEEYLENSFEEAVWEWGYLALIV